MEKAKSLLVYYSNRFLEGTLDHKINEHFGEAYRAYDAIKELAESKKNPVDLLNRPNFNEDSILRWQFVSKKSDQWIFDATEQYVLEHFLRPSLENRRKDKGALEQFIDAYIKDVKSFFLALRTTLERIRTDPEYYKLFVLLGPSTYLYPLIVRLAERGLLDQQASVQPPRTFLSLVEAADVRVYKTRGTDPQRDMTTLARDVDTITPEQIAARLRDIIKSWMSDAEFETRLRQNVHGNRALVRIFVALDEYFLRERGATSYSLEKLIQLGETEPTIEHVFSQEPLFDFPGHQFQSADEYREHNDKLGNLLVLEKRLNSRCNCRTVEEKISRTEFYPESRFECVQRFRQDCNANGPFSVAEIEKRTDKLVEFCLLEWPI